MVAASSWLHAAGPVGQWIDTALRTLVGGPVVLVPVILGVIAVVLMRTEPDPDSRPRLILGSAMIALPLLGLWHLWSGSPQDAIARQHAAGFIGFAIGGPLSDGLTEWIAAPLLFMGVLFGLLLVTGTTIREVPSTLRAMFSTRAFHDDDYDDEYDEYDGEYDGDDLEDDGYDDLSDGYYDDDNARGDARAQTWPTAAIEAPKARRVRRWTTIHWSRTRRLSPNPRSSRAARRPKPNRSPSPSRTTPWSWTGWWRGRTTCPRWIC